MIKEEIKVPKRIDYLKCKKPLNNLGITDEEINKALDQIGLTKKDLTDSQSYENGKPYCDFFEFERRGIGHFKKYNGDYVKEYTANADFYLIPAQYQGLKHGDIIFQILKNRFNWFDNFQKDKSYKESETGQYFDTIGRLDVKSLPNKYKNMTVIQLLELSNNKDLIKKESSWSIYEMYDEKLEMYLTTEYGSLYVPIKALLNFNWKVIEERMKSYALSYCDPINLSGFALNHRGRTKEQYKLDKKVDYANMIKPLVSKEAKFLQKIFKSNK